RLEAGIKLVAILAIGQNRWMFMTRNLGATNVRAGAPRTVPALRLAMPDSVERCQRRHYYRMEAAALNLPEVQMWPLLHPRAVLVGEGANERGYQEGRGGRAPAGGGAGDSEAIMPEVGPKFTATPLNIGGGGVGLRVRPEDAHILDRH